MKDNLRLASDKTKKADLQTRINTMELPEQLNLVLITPWERRFELITSSEKAGQIVANMPVEELFWTIKATGIEDSGILLGLSTPEQLQFIFDLDWWLKDRLRADKIAAWLLVMFELSENSCKHWLKWILHQDPWLFPALLNEFISVIKRPDDMDIQEAKDRLPPFTLDNVYFIDFKKKKLAPLFMRLITAILEVDPGGYRDIFETMLWQTPGHNLETAYRLRCGRIGDFGIPDYYDSLDIYSPLKPEQMHIMDLDDPVLKALPVNYDMPPFVPTLYVTEFPVLHEAVGRLAGKPIMERIVREATGVANKILMADLVDLDDPEQLQGALKKAFSMINLGVEYLSDKLHRQPYQILATHYLEEIARLSSWLLLHSGTEAKRLLKDQRFEALPHYLKQAVEEAAKRPSMLFIPQEGFSALVTTLSDLHNLEKLVDEAVSWHKVIDFLVPSFDKWPLEIGWEKTNMLAPEELAADSALATSVANLILKAKFKIEPIDKKGLELLQDKLKELDEHRLMEYLSDVLEPMSLDSKKGPSKEELQQIIIPRIINILEEFVSEKEPVTKEPRYVKNLLAYVG